MDAALIVASYGILRIRSASTSCQPPIERYSEANLDQIAMWAETVYQLPQIGLVARFSGRRGRAWMTAFWSGAEQRVRDQFLAGLREEGCHRPWTPPAPRVRPPELPVPRRRRVGDYEAALIIAGAALAEIRELADPARPASERLGRDTLQHIWQLADRTHNLPSVARTSRFVPQGIGRRPMDWEWGIDSPEVRERMQGWIAQAGCRWSPPTRVDRILRRAERRDRGERNRPPDRPRAWDRLTDPFGWPVRTGPLRRPVPPAARIVRPIDAETFVAWTIGCDEPSGQRDALAAWTIGHLAPGPVHFLMAEPDRSRRRSEHPDGLSWFHALLTMSDGTQLTGSRRLAARLVDALPATLPRPQQFRLAHQIVRRAKIDLRRPGSLGAWESRHADACSVERCGAPPYPHSWRNRPAAWCPVDPQPGPPF
ncbi:hypothetical protein [Actinospica robiniae]|uniref:hypothetical protein n=1 Tax=Actinospica robiniae TaxID=304901 RepID=UPI0003F88DEC|nr:hypothetical protein [Actinospica robiniae]